MASNPLTTYRRPLASALEARLTEPRRFIQALTGPRQVGKTTLVTQVADRLDVPVRIASADEPTLQGSSWISQQWEAARASVGPAGGLLVLDEVQKVPHWSESVKRLWDEDTRAGTPLKVVILGSAPLLISRGLTESLAGRFEVLHVPHWSYPEMRDAFGFTLDNYVYFGGYPGAAALIKDPDRWRRYILDSLIETTISRDVLLLTRVDKPALLRRLFELACDYSGQTLSYTKMLGQLQDAGNSTTLAHYLDLLSQAGMVTGLQKYSGSAVRKRGSSPKLQVLNTALMSAITGLTPAEAVADPTYYGRLVESAVGAHLANAAAMDECELLYWREGNYEVDFVVRVGRKTVAIEVKSGSRRESLPSMDRFVTEHKPDATLLVGADGVPLGEFLCTPVARWGVRQGG